MADGLFIMYFLLKKLISKIELNEPLQTLIPKTIMSKLFFLKKGAIVLLFESLSLISFGQKATYTGITLTTEMTSEGDVVAGLGLNIERKITKHSGIESGLYYRTYKTSLYISTGTDYNNFAISERHISLPVLYKFYSRIINFSVGPTFDFYVGWKQKSGYVIVNTYSIDPSFAFGFITKFSKQINLSDHLFLEPELRLNPILTYNRAYIGLGIAAKYKL